MAAGWWGAKDPWILNNLPTKSLTCQYFQSWMPTGDPPHLFALYPPIAQFSRAGFHNSSSYFLLPLRLIIWLGSTTPQGVQTWLARFLDFPR